METLLVAAISAVFGGGAAATVAVKVLNRPLDRASADRTQVETAMLMITQLVAEGAKKDEKIEALVDRVEKLEERERHMLTRAAVHEAWDQFAFQALVRLDPAHPPPPPLVLNQEDPVTPPD